MRITIAKNSDKVNIVKNLWQEKINISAILVLCLLVHPIPVSALEKVTLEDITKTITNICSQPSEAGKYWDVKVKGTGEADIRLLLPSGNVTGELTFSQKAWEGVRGTLEESNNYRECVKELSPLFLKFGMEANVRYPAKRKNRIGGVSWNTTIDGLNAELKSCNRKSTNMICSLVLTALNADIQSSIRCTSRDTCRSYDQEGNEFLVTNIAVANRYGTKRLKFNLLQGVPVKMSLTFPIFASSVEVPRLAIEINDKTFEFSNMYIDID